MMFVPTRTPALKRASESIILRWMTPFLTALSCGFPTRSNATYKRRPNLGSLRTST